MDYAYYYLSGGFGDIWRMVIYVCRLLRRSKDVKLIVHSEHFPILKLVVENDQFSRITTLTSDQSDELSQILKNDKISCTELKIEDGKRGMPYGWIKPLHYTYYPYLFRLLLNRKIDPDFVIKAIMGIPFASEPFLDLNYQKCDIKKIDELFGMKREKEKVALINVVNMSHVSLSNEVWLEVIELIVRHGYRVLINSTLKAGSFSHLLQEAEVLVNFIKEKYETSARVSIITVQGDLLPLLCRRIDLCVGCTGGAMSVAAILGSCDVIYFATDFKWDNGEIMYEEAYNPFADAFISLQAQAKQTDRKILFIGREGKGSRFSERVTLDRMQNYLSGSLDD